MQFPNENHFRTQPKLSLLRCAVATSNVGSRRILNKTARWCVFYTFKRSISKFPAHDLNFHGKWGARDQIKTSFKNDRTLTKSNFFSCRLLEWISPACIVVNWLFCLLWYKKQGNKTENEWFCEEKKVSVFFVVVNVFLLLCCKCCGFDTNYRKGKVYDSCHKGFDCKKWYFVSKIVLVHCSKRLL